MPQTTYTIQLSRAALAYLAECWGRAEHGHLWREPGGTDGCGLYPQNVAEGHIMGHLGLFVIYYF